MTRAKRQYQNLVLKIVKRADRLMSRIKSKEQWRELTNQDIDNALFRTGMIQHKTYLNTREKKNLTEVASWFESLYLLNDGKTIAQIWRLKFYEGKTIREIAEIMNLSKSLVQRKLIASYDYVRDKVSSGSLFHHPNSDLDSE